jgi:hypothetical protein
LQQSWQIEVLPKKMFRKAQSKTYPESCCSISSFGGNTAHIKYGDLCIDRHLLRVTFRWMWWYYFLSLTRMFAGWICCSLKNYLCSRMLRFLVIACAFTILFYAWNVLVLNHFVVLLNNELIILSQWPYSCCLVNVPSVVALSINWTCY